MKKLLVALLVLGLAAPAMAAEVGLYGSFRTHLGYYDQSEDFSAAAITGPAMDGTISAGDGFDDAGTVLGFGGQSRFGAKAKVSDTLNAVFEVGLRETSGTALTTSQGETVYLRLAYGTWNFGAGALTVGKDYTPGTFLGYSNMVGDIGDQGDAVLLVAGLPYVGRQPQVKLTFGGFQFALIEHHTFTAASIGADDVDFELPRMEAAYQLNTPMISLRPVVGYQTFDAVDRTIGGSEEDESIDSYMAGLGVQVRLNPAFIKATASYMVNAANYGHNNFIVGNTGLLSARAVGDDIEDSTLIQGTLVAGAKFSPMLTLEVGISYANVEVDVADDTTAEQTGMLYYIQLPLTVAPGMTITPEIGLVDRGDLEVDGADDVDQGELTYGVVSFRVDF